MGIKKGKFEYPNKINLPAIHQSQIKRNITLRSITKNNIIENNKDFTILDNIDLYTALDINEETEAKKIHLTNTIKILYTKIT